MRGGWGDYNTQMCKLHTKRVFISPLEVHDAELDDSCGSSETSCIIERADQLARVVVDRWCENIMSVDDLCESRFSRGEIDGPLLNVEHGIFDFLRGCFIPYRKQLHGILAIEVARKGKIFNDNLTSWSTTTTQPLRNATDDDLRRISSWANQLQADIERQNVKAVPPPIQPTQAPSIGPLRDLTTAVTDVSPLSDVLASPEEALDGLDVSHLRADQARAYGIIKWHLDQTLNGATPPLLRMVLYGEGGTGKSRVIQTVTNAFEARGSKHILVKAAYTVVAASLIGGGGQLM